MMGFGTVESLIRDIVPDVSDRPIYILDAAEWHVPRDVGLSVNAFTAAMLDLTMAAQLSQRGRWHGRGFATILFPDNIPSHPRAIAGTILHECAHYLTLSDSVREMTIEADIETASAIAAGLFCAAENAAIVSEQRRPPWHHHEADFVRAAGHLAYRYCKRVEGAFPWDLQFSKQYYGTCEMAFMRVLGPELQRMADEPIRVVLREAPPPEFTDLVRCLTSWWDAEESRTAKPTHASD
jgi:hypothetical protein